MDELVSFDVCRGSQWIMNCFDQKVTISTMLLRFLMDRPNWGKIVVTAALLRDRALEGFERNLHPLPKAEIITEMAAVWHLLDPNEGSFSKRRTIAGLYEIPLLLKEDLITRCRCWIHRLGSAQDWKRLSSSVKLLISLPNVLRIEQAQWRFYWTELPTWRKPCNLTCLKQLVSEPHVTLELNQVILEPQKAGGWSTLMQIFFQKLSNEEAQLCSNNVVSYCFVKNTLY